jgi:ATPase subunit of ABC transporter with duplicated ATPase domains
VDQLNLNISPLEYFQGKFSAQPHDLRTHLARFGIRGDLALQEISKLSGGQKSRVAIAELAYQKPHVLLLDEPTNHLDMETIDSLVDGIAKFEAAGWSFLLIHFRAFRVFFTHMFLSL